MTEAQMVAMKAMESKRKCLERFRDLSLQCTKRLAMGDFAGLKEFLEERDSILKAIDLYDRKLQTAMQSVADSAQQMELNVRTKDTHQAVIQLVEEIRGIDGVLLEKIEAEGKRVEEEVTKASRAKEALGKFRSGTDERGEELDQKV